MKAFAYSRFIFLVLLLSVPVGAVSESLDAQEMLRRLDVPASNFESTKALLRTVFAEPNSTNSERAVDALMSLIGTEWIWEMMPEGLKSKNDLTQNLLRIAEGAMALHVDVDTAISAVSSFVDRNNVHSLMNREGYSERKAPRGNTVLVKEMDFSLPLLTTLGITDKFEVYYVSMHGRIVRWMKRKTQ